jgi:5-methyltetrahydrofolate--homocysteine methyltransferase
LDQARARRLRLERADPEIPVPSFTGIRLVERLPLRDLVPLIDWTFFFAAWELKGRYPGILEHPQYGAAARDLHSHARAVLARIVDDELITASASYGFWAANAEGDDIVLYEGPTRDPHVRLPMLRQQEQQPDGRPQLSLADFLAPVESGTIDYLGAFAVTAGLGADALAAEYKRDHDDYDAIIVKALADRLAQAGAEYLHARVRREWGYEQSQPSPDDLIAERYRGIRPALGYPACPDHRMKRTVFALLQASRAGMALTETCAMMPAASVSGLYFAHSGARYFNVGKIGRDQLDDYAARTGGSVAETQHWLGPHLTNEPETATV